MVALDRPQIEVVHRAILDTCAHREWTALALTVQSTHVHVVLSASVAPEALLRDLKSWATRALRGRGDFVDRAVWAKHGSTRYLLSERDVIAAVRYVNDVHHQPSGEL